jgi:hypothetical protein
MAKVMKRTMPSVPAATSSDTCSVLRAITCLREYDAVAGADWCTAMATANITDAHTRAIKRATDDATDDATRGAS